MTSFTSARGKLATSSPDSISILLESRLEMLKVWHKTSTLLHLQSLAMLHAWSSEVRNIDFGTIPQIRLEVKTP